MFVGNTPKPFSSLNVTDILEMLGPQVLGTLKPVVFWLGVFLLLHITRRILYLVFDISNATRP